MANFWKLEPQVLMGHNVPKPMHGLAPRVVLGGRWWDKTRKAAYASTNFYCIACGVHKSQAKFRQWLEGHELYETDYKTGRHVYVRTVPLCHFCNNYIHDGRLEKELEAGRLNHYRYAKIIEHGDSVLALHGLFRPTRLKREAKIQQMMELGEVAEWHKWRLIIDGVEYKPLFKSEKEYEAYWQNHNADE